MSNYYGFEGRVALVTGPRSLRRPELGKQRDEVERLEQVDRAHFAERDPGAPMRFLCTIPRRYRCGPSLERSRTDVLIPSVIGQADRGYSWRAGRCAGALRGRLVAPGVDRGRTRPLRRT